MNTGHCLFVVLQKLVLKVDAGAAGLPPEVAGSQRVGPAVFYKMGAALTEGKMGLGGGALAL